jgi:hypothetical protein
MVLTVSGHLEGADLDAMGQNLCRFLRLRTPLAIVVDGDTVLGGRAAHLLDDFTTRCRRAGIEWHLVVGDRVEH